MKHNASNPPKFCIRRLAGNCSYDTVLSILLRVVQDLDVTEDLCTKEHNADGDITRWYEEYRDGPLETRGAEDSREFLRYINYTATVLEGWNRERCLYLSNQRLSKAVDVKILDGRVFDRNNIVWLRNAPSPQVAIERLKAVQRLGLDIMARDTRNVRAGE